MNIVFFEYAIHFGGARRSTVELASRLAKHAAVTIVDAYGCCDEFASAIRDNGLTYRVAVPQGPKIVGGFGEGLFRRTSRILSALPGLRKIQRRLGDILAEVKADVVLSNCLKGIATISTIPRNHVPAVGYLRGWYPPSAIPPYARYVLQNRVDRIFAVSHATRSALFCGGIHQDKIDVISNSVDIGALVAKANAPGCYIELPVFEKRPRILIAADYVHRKGHLCAIRAVAELIRCGYDPVLYCAGDVGWAGDPGYPEVMRMLAKDLGVSHNIHQIGVVNNIPALMRTMDIVILPSHTEGMPRVLLEAMAMKKPIVATPVGGILDLVVPGITGLLHNVDDHHELAKCIKDYVQNPELASSMAESAYCFVRDQFTPEKQVRAVMSALRCMVLAGDDDCTATRVGVTHG